MLVCSLSEVPNQLRGSVRAGPEPVWCQAMPGLARASGSLGSSACPLCCSFWFAFNHVEGEWVPRAVLVPGIQQSDSGTCSLPLWVTTVLQ